MKTSRILTLSVFAPLLAASCAADLAETADTPAAGKADVVTAPQLVAVANNTACISAPCPTITVLDTAGNVNRVADVVLPDGLEERMEDIYDAGLNVEGVIVAGDWNPGGPGDVLYVDAVNKPVGHAAPAFNGVTCFVAPCPSWTVLHDTGDFTQVAGVDLFALDMSQTSMEKLLKEAGEGRLLLGGFVRSGSWAPTERGDTFVVTRMTSVINDDYKVKAADFVCVTSPCPSYEAVGSAGATALHSINLDGLELSDTEGGEILHALHGNGIKLRGFINQITRDSISGSSTETVTVLHVTRALEIL